MRDLAPDFCWMTMKDLFLMAEQIDENVDWFSFKVKLCRCKDWFHTRPLHPPESGGKLQYLRKQRI
jgi:hypothetical protein